MNQDKHEVALRYLGQMYVTIYLSRVDNPQLIKDGSIVSEYVKSHMLDLLTILDFPKFSIELLSDYYKKRYFGLTQNVAEEQTEYNKFSSWYNNHINELQKIIDRSHNRDVKERKKLVVEKFNISFLKQKQYALNALYIYLYKIN